MAVVENTTTRFSNVCKAMCDGYNNINLRQTSSLRTDLDLPVFTLRFSRSFSVLLCLSCTERTVPRVPPQILLRHENKEMQGFHIWRLWSKQKQLPT